MLELHLFVQVAGKQWEAMQRKRITPVCVTQESSVCSNQVEQCFDCAFPDKLARETWRECGKTDVHDLLQWASLPFCIHHPSSLLTSMYRHWTFLFKTHIHTCMHTHSRSDHHMRGWNPAAQINATFPVWGILISCEDISRRMRHENQPRASFPWEKSVWKLR